MPAGALKLTPEQQYVQKLATKAMHERLAAGGGAAIAGLDFNAGRSLAAQVNNPGYLDKLEKQLRPLRQQLGIGGGADWSPDSLQYKARGAVEVEGRLQKRVVMISKG